MKKRNIIVALCFCVPLAILMLSFKYDLINFSLIDGHHFDIITISSIFAGFLFSSLSLILGLGKSNTVVFLERIDEMDSIFFNILTGITCSVISILFSLFQVLVFSTSLEILNVLELYLLVLLLVFFILSVNDVRFVVRHIRNDLKKSIPDKTKMAILNKLK